MGIDVQWIGERGDVRECVLDESDLLSEIVAGADEHSVCLRFIDPYGDAVFNQLQLPVLIEELSAVAANRLSREAIEHRQRVIKLATKARGKVHTYIKFYGD